MGVATIRIFLVEDHSYMGDMLRQFIELEEDLEVCGLADTGELALDAIPGRAPDVVVADVSLPGMNGLDLVEALQDRSPGIPCLLLTGHAERSHVVRARDAGARGYILKGEFHCLVEAIRHAAGRDYNFRTWPSHLQKHDQSDRDRALIG
jgi:DNA-binding NarL/FixJ family response regulator